MTNLNTLSLKETLSGVAEKKFSCAEIVKDTVKACKEETSLFAYISLDEVGALKKAEELDKKIVQNEEVGDFAGAVCAVKDIICVKGLRNTCASKMLENFVPPYDASVVSRLKKEDISVIGKTNTDEFACGASTETSHFGVTKNPFDMQRVAGGSSGGSAVAVAKNLCTFALGTDTGGSIRQPASFCNVYGLKPTYGLVSRSGVVSLASSWDTVGAFSKTPEDMAMILNKIAGKDRKDSTTLDNPEKDYTSFLNKGVKGLKIGLPKEYFSEGIEEETKALVMESVKKLEKAGAEVVQLSLPSTKYAVSVYYISMPAELSANLERFDGIRFGHMPEGDVENIVDYYFKARGEGFGTEIKRRIIIGTYVLSAGYMDAYYKKAQKVRGVIIEDFKKAFCECDVIIGPVSPYPAFKIGEFIDDPLKMYTADALTIPVNAAGIPSMACPSGFTKNGLSVGLQVIAPFLGEGRCLAVAEALRGL